MHRNLLLLLTGLAIFAALVVGVQIGRFVEAPPAPTPTPTPTIVNLSPTATPAPTLQAHVDTTCGISLQYPSSFTKLQAASGSATFTEIVNPANSISLTCQRDIPRVPLTEDRIETRVITNSTKTASVSARLYHDASAKDGTPVDKLIFRHPRTGLDVYLAGFGESFNTILASLTLYP